MIQRTPLGRVRGLGSAKSGARTWWHERLSAAAAIPLTLFLILLGVSLTGADHARVMAVLGHPVVSILLAAAILSLTWHMRLGMQAIIEDYVHSEGAKILLLGLNSLFCAGLVLIGLLAVLKLALGA